MVTKLKPFFQIVITYSFYYLCFFIATPIVSMFYTPKSLIDADLVMQYYEGMIDDFKVLILTTLIAGVLIILVRLILKKPIGEFIIKYEASKQEKRSAKFWVALIIIIIMLTYSVTVINFS